MENYEADDCKGDGGTTADGVLQADDAMLLQADRVRKTKAAIDCPKIPIGENLCAAKV